MTFGDFTVMSGESRNGGDLCPIGGGGECSVAPAINQVGEVPCWAVDAVNFVIQNELFSVLNEEDVRDAVKFHRLYQLIMGQ